MSELSIQNIKEVVIEVLEPFADSIQKDFQRVDENFQKVNERLDKMDGRFDNVECRLTNVERDVKEMKNKFDELFNKLDEFISLYKKQEQELLFLTHQVRNLEDRVVRLEAQRN